MKNKIIPFVGVLIAVILLLASCNIITSPAGQLTKGTQLTDQSVTTPGPGRGGFSIKVQAVAPAIQQLLAGQTGRTAAPRAYLSAAVVRLSVTGPINVIFDPISPSQGQPYQGVLNAGQYYLPSGSYTLNAEVYNSAADYAIDEASVSGSAPLTITAGTQADANQVTVTCLPGATYALSEGSGVETYLATQWTQDLLSIGDEAWFQTSNVTSNYTEFTIFTWQYNGWDAAPAMFVFDSAGHFLKSAVATGPEEKSASITLPTAIGSSYWIGVIDFGNSYDPVNANNFTIMCQLGSSLQVGLVGEWLFDYGSMMDTSGNGHDGTVVGNTLFMSDRFGTDSFAFQFDGTNYVDCGNPADNSLDLGANATIVGWAYWNSSATMTLVSKDEGSGEVNKWFLLISGGNLAFHINNPAQFHAEWLYSDSFTAPAPGEWFQFGIVKTGNTYNFYLNEAPVGTQTSINDLPLVGANLVIGNGESGAMNGAMDDVAMYNRALSAAEIAELYHWGDYPPFVGPSISPVESGQLVVNEANPYVMTYLWLDNSDDYLHAMRSTNGGAAWSSDIILSPLYDNIIDFAADMDANGNTVVTWIEATNADGTGEYRYSGWSRLQPGSSVWDTPTSIWGYPGGLPDQMLAPSVYRVGSTLKFGYGYMYNTVSNSHFLDWDGTAMSGYLGFTLSGEAIPGVRVFGDTDSETYYLYTSGSDVYAKDFTTQTAQFLASEPYDLAQPWLIQRSSDYLLVYVDSVGDIYAKSAATLADLGTAPSYMLMLATGVISANPVGQPYRTVYAAMDSDGIVHVVYQTSDGYIYQLSIDGDTYKTTTPATFFVMGYVTLDGIALNTEYSLPVLYVSYHDNTNNAATVMRFTNFYLDTPW